MSHPRQQWPCTAARGSHLTVCCKVDVPQLFRSALQDYRDAAASFRSAAALSPGSGVFYRHRTECHSLDLCHRQRLLSSCQRPRCSLLTPPLDRRLGEALASSNRIPVSDWHVTSGTRSLPGAPPSTASPHAAMDAAASEMVAREALWALEQAQRLEPTSFEAACHGTRSCEPDMVRRVVGRWRRPSGASSWTTCANPSRQPRGV